MNRGRRSSSVMLTVALGVLLAGCAAPQPEPPEQLVTALSTLSALPGDISAARTILREECLREAGFDVPSGAVTTMTSRAQFGSVVGIWSSEEQARSSGYSTTYVADVQHPLDAYAATLSEEDSVRFYEVLRGDGSSEVEHVTTNGASFARSDTGCEADSDVRIFGSLENAMEAELFVNDVNAAMADKTAGLPIEDEIGDYEECMQEQGYEVEGLRAELLAEDKLGQYRQYGGAPGTAERNLAVTDFRCQADSGLAEAVRRETARTISTWLLENETRMLELQELVAQSVDTAQGILHGER